MRTFVLLCTQKEALKRNWTGHTHTQLLARSTTHWRILWFRFQSHPSWNLPSFAFAGSYKYEARTYFVLPWWRYHGRMTLATLAWGAYIVRNLWFDVVTTYNNYTTTYSSLQFNRFSQEYWPTFTRRTSNNLVLVLTCQCCSLLHDVGKRVK